jgi:hypothetical protein
MGCGSDGRLEMENRFLLLSLGSFYLAKNLKKLTDEVFLAFF